MAYVARYSTSIEKDIELGFSCWLGTLGTDVVSALEIDGFNGEELEARYERFGSEYDSLEAYLKDAVLDESNIVWDERFGAYRTFHHNGLSCWALEAETEAEATVEAMQYATPGGMELAQYTIGSIRIVAEVAENLYLLECEAYGNEG